MRSALYEPSQATFAANATQHKKVNAASSEVLANQKISAADSRPKLSTSLPIVTASGFTVLEGSRVGGTTDHRFLVRAATGAQRNISVCFDRSLMARVDQARGAHLWIGSRFWGFRAEAHLEAYLSEKADYPPNGQLVIDELSGDEMLLARHWQG